MVLVTTAISLVLLLAGIGIRRCCYVVSRLTLWVKRPRCERRGENVPEDHTEGDRNKAFGSPTSQLTSM